MSYELLVLLEFIAVIHGFMFYAAISDETRSSFEMAI